MKTKIIKREDLWDLKEVSEVITYTSRWAIHKEIVFLIDDEYWIGKVEYPATEYQEMGYDDCDEITLYPAKCVKKIIDIWQIKQ